MKNLVFTLLAFVYFNANVNAATCRVTNSANQTIADQSLIAINFDTTLVDNFTADCHDEAIFTHYIMFQKPGCYTGNVQLTFSSDPNGDRLVTIFAKPELFNPKGSATPIAAVTQKATGSNQPTRVNVPFNYCHPVSSPQQVGGVFVNAYQTSGSTLSIYAGMDYTPIFWAVKVD